MRLGRTFVHKKLLNDARLSQLCAACEREGLSETLAISLLQTLVLSCTNRKHTASPCQHLPWQPAFLEHSRQAGAPARALTRVTSFSSLKYPLNQVTQVHYKWVSRFPTCLFDKPVFVLKKFIFYFNWRVITLQYCVSFCHTSP